MEIQSNTSLLAYNTFNLDVKADYLIKAKSITDLKDALLFAKSKAIDVLILGGGSNVLFRSDYKGLVILLETKGIEILKEDDKEVVIRAAAGENWNAFVEYCVKHCWYGIENLALIPGNVGTCPIQNIGAYGVEVKDVIDEVRVMDRSNFAEKTFKNNACQFGYRNSIFKGRAKGKYIITDVVFRLKKEGKLNTTYGAIRSELEKQGITKPTLKNVMDIVIHIRNSKLPDTKRLGNAGSFFKNPIIHESLFQKIKSQYPEIPYYPETNNHLKIPAGWLIEKAGLKGVRQGNVGMHEKQALVLVNYGGANSHELINYKNEVIKKVKLMFGISLEVEVNII